MLITANILRWTGLLGVLTVAVMRSATTFAPQTLFDVDPARDPTPFAGFGPPGSLTLDVLLLIACAAALAGEALSTRRLRWLLLTLAALPVPVVLWHGWHDSGDLWRGATWLAAAIAAVTIVHLAREQLMRIIVIAILLGALAPMMVRGVGQVTFEHRATVAAFEEQREQFLAERGWEPDSDAARIYERRLRQPQPRGWFDTTNILASVLTAGLTVWLGLSMPRLSTAAQRQAIPAAGAHPQVLTITLILAVLAFAAAIGVWLSGSKGALAVALMGAALAAAPLLHEGVRGFLKTHGPRLLAGLLILALLGVVVRGAMLPEGFAGDRSLLFRWHYMLSAAHVFAESPFLGTGPDGFQDAYMRHRLPRNPEEVASAHSMFIDWLATLGVSGTAWIALAVMLLWRGGTAWRTSETPAPPGAPDHVRPRSVPADFVRITFRCAAAVAVLGLLPALAVEGHVLGDRDLILRTAGIILFIAVAVLTAWVMHQRDGRVVGWLAASAAAVLLVHGQIEMTFFQPGAAVWLMCLLGAAGAVDDSTPRRVTPSTDRSVKVPTGFIAPLVLLVLAAWLLFTGAIPSHSQQALIREAAAALYPPASEPAELMGQRETAALTLVAAYERDPRNVRPLHEAALQYLIAAGRLPEQARDERIGLLQRAMLLADRAVAEHDRPRSLALRSNIAQRLAIETEDTALFAQAIADVRALAQRDPHGIGAWVRLGDLLWSTGRHEEAGDAYARALHADANFELDPLKQLSSDQRDRIRARIDAVADTLTPR